MRATKMEINLKAYKENMKKIQEYVGNKELMPVIKANGYGTHINMCIDVISEYNIVALAIVDEGKVLRNLGYKNEIFILNQPDIDDIEDIFKYDITIGLSSKEFLNYLKEYITKTNNKIKVHLEIETGMNRTGIKLENLQEFINCVKENKNIIVEGVYTHLAAADDDDEYTKRQFAIFEKAVNIVKKEFDTIKYIHASASNGLLKYKENITNLVRPGIIMYGYESYKGVNKILDLKPIAKLKSKITYLKDVDKGETISYSRTYKTKDRIKVATVPIGYADGVARTFSNNGEVVINQIKCPIVGKVCMDSIMVDVSGVKDAKVGDEVFIWDNNLITVDDLADTCDTINYEVLCRISDRVPRVFID